MSGESAACLESPPRVAAAWPPLAASVLRGAKGVWGSRKNIPPSGGMFYVPINFKYNFKIKI